MLQAFVYLSFVGTIFCLELVPPQNIWVREAQNNVTLVCQASEKIRSCSWTTPYGDQIPLQPGLMAEGGRLMHFANNNDLECGIMISVLEAKDNGKWKCNVGVVENSEVETASGIASITIATPPSDVYLETPFDQLTSNFTHGGVNKVRCVAKNSTPAPTFKWTVGDMVLNHHTENKFDEDNKVFTQTLHFIPTLEHGNQTLKCIIEHPGMDKTISAGTEVKITGESSMEVVPGLGVTTLVAIIIVAVLVVVAIIAGVTWFGKNGRKQVDEEKAVDDENKDDKDQTDKPVETSEEKQETEVTNETAEEKKGFDVKSKIVKILAQMKPKEKKPAEDVVATEFEKVELTEGEEKKDDEKEEDVSKPNFMSKVTSIFSKFKSSPKESTEEEPVDIKINVEEVNLEPENTEEKVPERRRGSETPV